MAPQIGRRIFRQRLETGDRDGDMEQRRVGVDFVTSHYYYIRDLGLDHYSVSSAGISEVDLCFKYCVWRSISFPFTLEASFQGY